MARFNTLAIKTFLFGWALDPFKNLSHVFAQAQAHHEGRGLRFPVSEPGGRRTRPSQKTRALTPICSDDEIHICDWDDSTTPKYAVCTTAGETKCVYGSETTVGTIYGGGKGSSFEVGGCGCCDIGDEYFCGNLPLQEPDCSVIGDFSGCDENYPDKILFCYEDLSKSGKKSETKQKCGDPYAYPNYEKGDKFVGCGENCNGSAQPSVAPSSEPSTQPSVFPLITRDIYEANPIDVTDGSISCDITLNADVDCSLATSPCITLIAGATLDCNGYTIKGPGDGSVLRGIYVTGAGAGGDVTIRNCNIEGFERCVEVSDDANTPDSGYLDADGTAQDNEPIFYNEGAAGVSAGTCDALLDILDPTPPTGAQQCCPYKDAIDGTTRIETTKASQCKYGFLTSRSHVEFFDVIATMNERGLQFQVCSDISLDEIYACGNSEKDIHYNDGWHNSDYISAAAGTIRADGITSNGWCTTNYWNNSTLCPDNKISDYGADIEACYAVPVDVCPVCSAYTQTGYLLGGECGPDAPAGSVCTSGSCDTGYSGIPTGSVQCGSDGNWIGSFSGCSITICIPGDSPIERLTDTFTETRLLQETETREYETVNVSELRIGDYVRCFDQISNTVDFCKVYNHHHRRDTPNTQYLKFTFTSNGGSPSPDNFRASLTHFQYVADPTLALGTTSPSVQIGDTNFKQARYVEIGDKMLVWIPQDEVLRVEEVTNIEQIVLEDAYAPAVANGDTIIAGGALLSTVSAPGRALNILETYPGSPFSTWPIFRGAAGASLWFMPDSDFEALPLYGLERDDQLFQDSPRIFDFRSFRSLFSLVLGCKSPVCSADILGFQDHVFDIVRNGPETTLNLTEVLDIFQSYLTLA